MAFMICALMNELYTDVRYPMVLWFALMTELYLTKCILSCTISLNWYVKFTPTPLEDSHTGS